MKKYRKKPDELDLKSPRDRVVILRAYHALLSQGVDEDEAKRGAVRYALEHWNEITAR